MVLAMIALAFFPTSAAPSPVASPYIIIIQKCVYANHRQDYSKQDCHSQDHFFYIDKNDPAVLGIIGNIGI